MASGDPPPIRLSVSAPGKVILHGEHSVVYGKTALAASLSLRTRLDLSETRADSCVRLELPDIRLSYAVDVAGLNRLLDEPSLALRDSLPRSAYNWEKPDLIDRDRFVAWLKDTVIKGDNWDAGQQNALVAFHFLLLGILCGVDVAAEPFELRITSELSIGAGLGSSASYSVCLAAGLLQYARCRVARAGRLGEDIARPGFLACRVETCATDIDPSRWPLEAEDRDLVGQWAKVGDGIMHGTASGVDTATIVTGGVVEFRRGAAPGGGPHFAPVPLAAVLKIVLVDTGVCRDTKRMVDKVRDLKSRLPGVIDPLFEAMDGVALAARALLTQADCLDRLGELVELNHHLLRALGVSHPALEDICAVATKHGLSGKLTGAGGGGYALVLLPPSTPAERVTSLLADLEGRGYRSVVTSLGGPGVEIEQAAQ